MLDFSYKTIEAKKIVCHYMNMYFLNCSGEIASFVFLLDIQMDSSPICDKNLAVTKLWTGVLHLASSTETWR